MKLRAVFIYSTSIFSHPHNLYLPILYPYNSDRSAATMSTVSSSFFTGGKDLALPSSKSSNLSGPRKSSSKSLRGRLSDRHLRRSQRSIVLSKSENLAAASCRRLGGESVANACLDASSSHGHFESKPSKNDFKGKHGSSGDECCSSDGQKANATCDNPICKVHSICQSIVGTVTSPSDDQQADGKELPEHGQGSGAKWARRDVSDCLDLAKSESSTKSIRGAPPPELVKSSSSRVIKWCFRKSKSHSHAGLRSPPELLPPSPPEVAPLTEESARPLLAAGADIENYLLLPSYYG